MDDTPDVLRSGTLQTSDLPNTLRAMYSSELDFTARGNVIYDQFAERKKDFTGNKGDTVTWTVYQNLPPSIRPLVEDQDVGGISVADFQVSLTIEEYGIAVGTTQKLDLISWHGPVSNLVRTMLGPQMALTTDLLARNAIIGQKATYRTFAGGVANRTALTVSGGKLTPQIAKAAAYNLGIRRIPPMGDGYVAVVHPAQIYDLRDDPFWIDVNKYTRPDTILNGEVGKLYGVRFIEANNARLPNAGATRVQTTLSGDVRTNTDFINVTDATGFAVGGEVTIHRYAAKPDGTDETEEHFVIREIVGNRLYSRSKITMAHSAGDYVTDGIDVYPTVFMGAVRGLGRGAVLEPEVRVALPTDKLRRQYHVGWYALMGYGIIRDWALEVVETAATVSGAPAFPW
jgi:N4-gp56 family major capsid protein